MVAPAKWRTRSSGLPRFFTSTSCSLKTASTAKATRRSARPSSISSTCAPTVARSGSPSTSSSHTSGISAPSWRIVSRSSARRISVRATRRMRSILAVGTTKVWPPALTSTPLKVASVTGSTMRNAVPAPRPVSMATVPPSRSTLSRTMAMPRPRPEISVMMALVETPDVKMSASAAAPSSARAWSVETALVRTAEAFTFSTSMPAPSSATRISTLPPSSGVTASRSWPAAGLCAARRAAGASRPWSMALRTRCRSGSFISCRMRLSISTSRPSRCSAMSLSCARARSRTSFGKTSSSVEKGSITRRLASARRSSMSVPAVRSSRAAAAASAVRRCSTVSM